jgi:hypothetical protein
MAVAYMAFPLPGGGQEETIELLDWKAISWMCSAMHGVLMMTSAFIMNQEN